MNDPITPQRSNTILYCRHWAPSVRFYRETLGLPVTFENDWFVEFRLTGTSFLSVANAARATIADVQGQGFTMSLQVSDLEQTRAVLERRGVSTTAIRRKWNAEVFYCHDPEGHRLEFWMRPESTVHRDAVDT